MTTRFQAFRNIFTQSGRIIMVAALSGFLLSGCQLGQHQEKESLQLQRAKKLIEQGNFAAAFIELNQALQEAPKDPNLHLNLGWLYLYTDDPENASRELTKAETLGPDLAETYHLKGALFSYRAQRDKNTAQAKELQEDAIQNFQQALERDEKNDQTYFDLATSLTAVDRDEEALAALDKGFEYIPPKDLETQVNFQIASCAARSKMHLYEEAIKDCNQALEFTTNPASRDRIESMIENMKLLNPGLETSQPTEEQAGNEEGATD